eukprot:TRINITY_DN16396_c0_g1_i1.p1 TRINITY_DN16396_c0_g1~~TRINITY_DN16396_c0_g1_i1.p1  ORF type:complete len:402 (+),score=91.36 TRINITY_DN16396_c0_g1_i1:61-1266(+)
MYAEATGETLIKQQLHHQLQQSIQHEPSTAVADGGSEHQRSLLSLIKLQTLDECEERWQDRAAGWQSELQISQEKNNELTGALNNLHTSQLELQKLLSTTQDQLASVTESNKASEAANKKLLEKNKDLEQEVSALRNENLIQQNTITMLEASGKDHQTVVLDLNSKIESIQQQNMELLHTRTQPLSPPKSPRDSSRLIESLENQLRQVREERDRFSSDMQQLIYQKADLEKGSTATKLQFQHEVRLLQEELRNIATVNNTHIKEASKYRNQELQIIQLRNAFEDAASDAASYKEQLATQIQRPDQLQEQASVTEVQLLKSALKKVKKELKMTLATNNQLLQEKSEWKYKALMAKPSSARCRNCDSRVTLWPQPYQQMTSTSHKGKCVHKRPPVDSMCSSSE